MKKKSRPEISPEERKQIQKEVATLYPKDETQQLREQLADNDQKWKEKVDLLEAQLNDNDEQWKNKLADEREEWQLATED